MREKMPVFVLEWLRCGAKLSKEKRAHARDDARVGMAKIRAYEKIKETRCDEYIKDKARKEKHHQKCQPIGA